MGFRSIFISVSWLQFLSSKQIQKPLLLVVGLSVYFDFHVFGHDPLAANAFKRLDHILKGPLPVFAFSVLGEERFEPLPRLPLQVVNGYTRIGTGSAG